MATIWFVIIAGMLITYVLLDGFDIGAGVVHLLIARTEGERRMVLGAIGPVWDGNEVWLVAVAAMLYLVFPLLFASAFSGFYLPLIMVLWLLMLRGIGIEFRSHVHDPLWAVAFNVMFSVASILLAIFLGAALANVVRGVPLRADGYFFEPLWTNFRVGTDNGILDWYTVTIGAVTLVTLAVHGSLYVAVKTDGDLNARARRLASALWPAQALLTGVGVLATVYVRPAVIGNFLVWPVGFAIPLAVIVGLVWMFAAERRQNDSGAFAASCAYIVGMLAGAVFALYPLVLPASTNSNYSLTIHNTAAGAHGMQVALVWWALGMIPTIAYFVFVYRMFRGKVRIEDADAHGY